MLQSRQYYSLTLSGLSCAETFGPTSCTGSAVVTGAAPVERENMSKRGCHLSKLAVTQRDRYGSGAGHQKTSLSHTESDSDRAASSLFASQPGVKHARVSAAAVSGNCGTPPSTPPLAIGTLEIRRLRCGGNWCPGGREESLPC